MAKKDLFYQDVEGRMEEMKQQPIKKEKSTRGEKISKTFSFLIGSVSYTHLSCRRSTLCRSRWSPYH